MTETNTPEDIFRRKGSTCKKTGDCYVYQAILSSKPIKPIDEVTARHCVIYEAL